MKHDDHLSPYQAFMLVLSVAVLFALAMDFLFDLDDETRTILLYADTAVCAVFFADFLYLLYTAPHRARYLVTWGWLDLISSIPAIGPFRLGRGARVVRILRVSRGARAAKHISHIFVHHRAQSTLLLSLLVTLVAMVMASAAVLYFERGAGGSIESGEHAFWWAIVTTSTVGYGDVVPITEGGRIVGVVLIMVSVAMLAILTAFIAHWFMGRAEAVQERMLGEMRADLDDIKQALRELQASSRS